MDFTKTYDSFNFQAGQAWNRLPLEIKNAGTVENFKNKISTAKIYCSCKLKTMLNFFNDFIHILTQNIIYYLVNIRMSCWFQLEHCNYHFDTPTLNRQ